jgi:hypothetical protein
MGRCSFQKSAPAVITLENGHNGDMWETFWADVLVAVIGAALTVAIAIGSFMLQRRRVEEEALRGLIEEIHRRRAFAPVTPVRVPDAADLRDYERVSRSVLDVRNQIRQARDRVRPKAAAHVYLGAMISACNRYLEDSTNEPDNYIFQLMNLREQLEKEITEIAKKSRNLPASKPGTGAY